MAHGRWQNRVSQWAKSGDIGVKMEGEKQHDVRWAKKGHETKFTLPSLWKWRNAAPAVTGDKRSTISRARLSSYNMHKERIYEQNDQKVCVIYVHHVMLIILFFSLYITFK